MPRIKPYNLHPEFEKSLIYAVTTKPTMFGRIGSELEADALSVSACKLALSAALGIARDAHVPPSSASTVLQRVRSWMGEGKIVYDDVLDVEEFYASTEPIPDAELLAEIVPILKTRLHQRAVETSIVEAGKRGDVERAVVPIFDRARKLDQGIAIAELAIGFSPLNAASAEQMAEAAQLERLPTSIMEVDDYLGGGAARGTLNAILAGTGVGKTMSLVQMAASALINGYNVYVATLEVTRAEWLARICANLLAIPLDVVRADLVSAVCRVNAAVAGGVFGHLQITDFTPRVTKTGDVFALVAKEEKAIGKDIDLLVVDSADHVAASRPTKNESSYVDSRGVYEELHAWAKDNDRWVWTVAHVQRRGAASKVSKATSIDTDDVADSMHKVRIADLIITVNPDGDDQASWFFAKHRHGKSRGKVGPLPIDNECARVAPSVIVLGSAP